MVAPVLKKGAMNIGTTLSVSCALAVTFINATFEAFRDLSTSGVPAGNEAAAGILIRVVTPGIVTFLVTSIAWKFLVGHRLRTIAEQIRAINPAARHDSETSFPQDEFTSIMSELTELADRQALMAANNVEVARLSGLSLIGERVLRRATLAAEHVSSLLVILRIAHEYNQPVPTGAIHNLSLVEKDLQGLQKDLEDQLILHSATTSVPRKTRLSEELPVSVPGDWTETGTDARFRATGLRIVPAKLDHTAKL
jgi:hypothetical protein